MPNSNHTQLQNGDDDMVTGIRPSQSAKKAFAQRLYQLNLKKGWNQSDLAREATNAAERGVIVSRDNVSTYMRGSSVPGEPKLKALAKALEVEPTVLWPHYVPAADDPRLTGRFVDDAPAFEVKAVFGEHDKVALRVNRTVSVDTAAKIMSLLQGDDDTANENIPNAKSRR